jgi:hypothetical protein
MLKRKGPGTKMIAIQLTCDEGAFICNIDEADIGTIAARKSGTYVIVHCAIRLDTMLEGQYEIYRTKTMEASSIDSYQPFRKKKGR